jgi:mycofactocin precursor
MVALWHSVPLPSAPGAIIQQAAARTPAAGVTREAGMTQQTVIEATPAQPTLTEGEPAGRPADEALVADELLVEEVSIDGMCGVY